MTENGKRLVDAVDRCLTVAQAASISTGVSFYNIQGMSGKKYRCFINSLIGALGDTSYLEVGTWVGSTFCSAIHGNKVHATVIDNWEGQYKEWESIFHYNLKLFKTPGSEVRVIKSDFRKVDYDKLGQFNVYMFDGPHEERDQYDGITLALPALADEFVLIVDDWNWAPARRGTMGAIAANGLNTLYEHEIRTTWDESQPENKGPESDWHNGYYIAVLSKARTNDERGKSGVQPRMVSTEQGTHEAASR